MRTPFGPLFLTATLAAGCAHAPMLGAPIYSAAVPGDEESLVCLAETLESAGFDVEESLIEGELMARRASSAGFGGDLHSTYHARAHLEDGESPKVILEVTIPDPGRPRGTRPYGISKLRSGGYVAKKQASAQSRVVLRAEFDPMLSRCAANVFKGSGSP